MADLVKIETSLSIEAKALLSPLAKDVDETTLERVLTAAMSKAFADKGIKVAEREEEIQYLVSVMPGEVLEHVPCIRIDEIPVAIKKGILKEYGEYYGLNVVSFIQFLKAHYSSEKRMQDVLSLPKKKEEQYIPTEKELEEISIQNTIKAYEKYKHSGVFDDFGNAIYNFLDKKGLITFTAEIKRSFICEAKENIKKRYDPEAALTREEYRSFSKIVNSIDNMLDQSGSDIVIIEAKKVALNAFFKNILTMEMDIKDLLTNEGD